MKSRLVVVVEGLQICCNIGIVGADEKKLGLGTWNNTFVIVLLLLAHWSECSYYCLI
jgi:hypothetical protein